MIQKIRNNKMKVAFFLLIIIGLMITLMIIVSFSQNNNVDNNQNNLNGSETEPNGNETDSDGNETDSDGNETDSDGNETDPNGNETDSDGNETDSDGNETDPNGNETDSDGNETDSNGNETDPNGNGNESDGNETDPNENETTQNYEVTSVISMITMQNLKKGDTVQTDSYHEGNNKGSAHYDIIDTINGVADGVNIIELDNGLYAVFSNENNEKTINHYGAYGDGVNDDSLAINVMLASEGSVTLNSDSYLIDKPIVISNSSDLKLSGNNTNLIFSNEILSQESPINILNSQNITIEGLTLMSSNDNNIDYENLINISQSHSVKINYNQITSSAKKLINIKESSDISLLSNEINYTVTASGNAFDSIDLIKNNNIELDSQNNSILDVFSLGNNSIVSGNTISINSKINNLFVNTGTIQNNNVTINETANNIFDYSGMSISKEISIEGNEVINNFDEMTNGSNSTLINLTDTKLNNKEVNVTNNNISGNNINNASKLLIYNSLDLDKQTINVNNNETANYKIRYIIGNDNISVIPKHDEVISSIFELKNNTTLNNGDIVKTESYHENLSKGSALYTIVDNTSLVESAGEVIQLNNGKYALMINTGNEVSVNQFGAYGDGISGEVDALNAAFASGYENLYLEAGSYMIEKFWELSQVSNVNFDARNNLIFFDNTVDIISDRTQTSDPKYSEFAFRIINSSHIDFVNLNMENLASDHDLKQLGILRSGDISITNSRFYSPVGVRNTNIDLWSDWENIVIDNNELIIEADTAAGGSIWVRDVQNKGCENAVITNNYIYKQAHDELLAVFQGEVHDVYIAHNEFVSKEGVNSETSIMNIRLGSESNTAVSGIVFENNTLDIQAKMGAIWGDIATDTIVRNNVINFKKVDDTTYGYVIDGDSHSSSSAGKFAVYEGNTLTVTASNDNHTIYVYNDIDLMKNDEVTMNANFSTLYSSGIDKLYNSVATINNYGKRLIRGVNHTNTNDITINNHVEKLYSFPSLSADVVHENNTINYLYDQVITDKAQFTVIELNNMVFNNHSITFNNNVLNHEKANLESDLIFASVEDDTPKNIYMNYNDWAGYTNQRLYPVENRHLYNIVITE